MFWPTIVKLPATAHVHFLSAQGHCEYVSGGSSSQREKKRLRDTEGQVLRKCFCKGKGILHHFSVTHFISQQPPAGWTALNSIMSEVKTKHGFQNEMVHWDSANGCSYYDPRGNNSSCILVVRHQHLRSPRGDGELLEALSSSICLLGVGWFSPPSFM